MKISIKRKVPTSVSLNPKHKPKYKTVEKQIEVKDELLAKYIALIDELFDRTWDELENRSWAKTVVPLVPFPFFEKYRELDNTDGDSWIIFWLLTPLRDVIFERAEIMHTLFELGGIEEIEKDPVVDPKKGLLNGSEFVVSINRDELRTIRKKLFPEFEKQQNGAVRSIDLSDVSFHQALYLLRAVFNKAVELLEAVCSGPIMMSDTRANFSYTILLQAVHEILDMKGFEELKKGMPELADSLVGDLTDADSEWEYGYGPQSRNFFAKIEKLYIKTGAIRTSLPRTADIVLAEADKALEEHRKQKHSTWSKMTANLDERKKRGEFDFGGSDKEPEIAVPDTFTVSVKDREIWVNDFILSRPFATHPNKEFFDYVYAHAGETLLRSEIPDYAKRALQGGKSFVSVLNNIGFKSQILRAFFPKRGKTSILLTKNVSAVDLKERGVKTSLLLQELRTAHAKNSPE